MSANQPLNINIVNNHTIPCCTKPTESITIGCSWQIPRHFSTSLALSQQVFNFELWKCRYRFFPKLAPATSIFQWKHSEARLGRTCWAREAAQNWCAVCLIGNSLLKSQSSAALPVGQARQDKTILSFELLYQLARQHFQYKLTINYTL